MTNLDRMALELEINDKTQRIIDLTDHSAELINDLLQKCDDYRRLLDKMALTASEGVKEN